MITITLIVAAPYNPEAVNQSIPQGILPTDTPSAQLTRTYPQGSTERRLSSTIVTAEADDDGFDNLLASIGFGRWQVTSVVMVLISEYSYLCFVSVVSSVSLLISLLYKAQVFLYQYIIFINIFITRTEVANFRHFRHERCVKSGGERVTETSLRLPSSGTRHVKHHY